MNYKCLLINDSGAVEFSDKFLDNAKPDADTLLRGVRKNFQLDPPTLEFEMYDDPEFNQLNDILHAPENFIINDRTRAIIESFKLPTYKFGKAVVSRVDKKIMFLKSKNEYSYHWLYFAENVWDEMYRLIDFSKSDIEVYEDAGSRKDIMIETIDDIYELINVNGRDSRSYNWKANKIVFKRDFDLTLDIFRLPLFSWMTYVSDRLRNRLLEQNVIDIKFVDTGLQSRLKAVENPPLHFS